MEDESRFGRESVKSLRQEFRVEEGTDRCMQDEESLQKDKENLCQKRIEVLLKHLD